MATILRDCAALTRAKRPRGMGSNPILTKRSGSLSGRALGNMVTLGEPPRGVTGCAVEGTKTAQQILLDVRLKNVS